MRWRLLPDSQFYNITFFKSEKTSDGEILYYLVACDICDCYGYG